MDLRCCFCDMDGTVLNSNNRMPDETRGALLALRDRGVRLVLATGRSDLQIREFLDVLKIDTPVITCNGGVIKDPSGKVLDAKYFDPADAKALISFCTKNGLDFLLYTPNYVYHSDGSTRINKYVVYNETALPKHQVPIRHIREFPQDGYSEIVKCLITHDLALMPTLESELNKNKILSIVSSGDCLIDIMPGNATSKGDAVKRVCEILNIPTENTAAFGDSPNDLTMFRTVGFAVAMGNAVDEVKRAADFVSKTNDEFGVKVGIEHIFSL